MSAVPATIAPRVRVTKFLTNLALGGTEKQVVGLAGALDRERFDVEIACFGRWGELVDAVERLGVTVDEYPVRALARFGTVRQQFRFAATLAARRTQVMHSYNFYANVFALPAARLAGVPCVVASIRDTGAYLDSAKRRLQRLACRFAHRVVVNADAIRNWLIEDGYDGARIITIPNGLDVRGYTGPRGGHAFRDELGIPRDARLVLLLARVNRQKGIDYFVEAAAEVLLACPGTHFVIVGGNFDREHGHSHPEGEYRREVEAAASRLGLSAHLHFTGFRDDVPAILAEADLSVLPSLSEGLSNTLLESMAAGTPVVATRVGGTPEAIDDRVHGLLVPPRDAAALAHAMSMVLTDEVLARRLGAHARTRVADRYSFDQMARETGSLYERILDEKISIQRPQ
ncbi:MAG: glycosyltransferase [Xanthomonadaceae bacterium]|nr:glycosyltransferase [Xanthomonadaceae bacterium]